MSLKPKSTKRERQQKISLAKCGSSEDSKKASMDRPCRECENHSRAGTSSLIVVRHSILLVKSLTAAERRRIRKAHPISLNTANGMVDAEEVLYIYVHDLGITLEFYILPDVPPVISMGFLTKINYQFTWKKFDDGEPAMRITLPSGTFTVCLITNDVPRIFVADTDVKVSDPEDADVETDTVKTAPRVKHKRGGRKHTATATGDSPTVMQPVQLSDALPMEMKAPAEPKKPKDTKPVLKAESDADEIEDPLPVLVERSDSGGEG